MGEPGRNSIREDIEQEKEEAAMKMESRRKEGEQ